MNLSLIFNKLKGLFPAVVVASAVAITVKLLKTETPQNHEILQVKAEEDIKTENYEDIIQEPQPPEPEVSQEEVPSEPEDTAQDTEEEEEVGEDEEKQQDSQPKEEQKEQSQEQQKPPATNRKFKPTLMGKLLGKLIKPQKKG